MKLSIQHLAFVAVFHPVHQFIHSIYFEQLKTTVSSLEVVEQGDWVARSSTGRKIFLNCESRETKLLWIYHTSKNIASSTSNIVCFLRVIKQSLLEIFFPKSAAMSWGCSSILCDNFSKNWVRWSNQLEMKIW